MTFSKILLPNIGGSFENHQNILMFPLLVWILRVVSKHFYVNKFWNISIYFGHFQKLHEIDGKTFSHIMGRSKVKKLREINRNYDHDAMIIWRETATISFLTNFDGKTFLIILACYGVKKFESFLPKIMWNLRQWSLHVFSLQISHVKHRGSKRDRPTFLNNHIKWK